MSPSPVELTQPHNQILFDEHRRLGGVALGPYSSFTWRHDPRHLLFTLSRYKFCAKLLAGKESVLEIGCGDGIGSAIVLQSVKTMLCTDLEHAVIQGNAVPLELEGRLTFAQHDIVKYPISGFFDAAISIDVIEHIDPAEEYLYMKNICAALRPHGIFIVGTPNIESERHASKNSCDGHINLKSADTLRNLLQKSFHNVLMFSMNDEVVHTGYAPMAHFLFGVGIGVK